MSTVEESNRGTATFTLSAPSAAGQSNRGTASFSLVNPPPPEYLRAVGGTLFVIGDD